LVVEVDMMDMFHVEHFAFAVVFATSLVFAFAGVVGVGIAGVVGIRKHSPVADMGVVRFAQNARLYCNNCFYFEKMT